MSDEHKREIVPAGRILRAYAPELGKHPWLFTMVIVGMAGIVATDLVAPLYLKEFFNRIAGTTPTGALVSELLMIIGVVIMLYLGNWIAFRIYSLGLMNLELKAMSRLYNQAFDYLVRHSQQFFTSQFTGTLTRRVAKYSDAFETLMDTVFMQFIPTLVFVVGAVIVLATQHPWLGAILAVWSVVFIIVQVWLANLRQPLREAQSAAESERTGATADAISNQSAITQFAAEEAETRKLAGVVAKWRRAALRSWGADELIWAVLGLLMIGIQGALLYAAVELWSRGLLTVGDFVLIQAYLITTFERLIGINRDLRRFYAGLANASEMITILDTEYDIKDAPGARELLVEKGAVTFEGVSFGYHSHATIADFDLAIRGGEKVAFVGPSGAGKSTITKLMLRLYDVTGGAIRIDGQDIREVTQESLREAISFVPQEPALFHRTLRENIAYGRPDASDEEIIEAARKAHCHEFISGLPQGYDTLVGERGVKLSGGERQRVAIARAILKNAPILVLDEATSSLDSESEALIQDALKTLMEGKTVVVIAHRLSTIMSMDRILVLEGGKIVAEGTHDELVTDTSGLYHKLWSIQAGGFIAE